MTGGRSSAARTLGRGARPQTPRVAVSPGTAWPAVRPWRSRASAGTAVADRVPGRWGEARTTVLKGRPPLPAARRLAGHLRSQGRGEAGSLVARVRSLRSRWKDDERHRRARPAQESLYLAEAPRETSRRARDRSPRSNAGPALAPQSPYAERIARRRERRHRKAQRRASGQRFAVSTAREAAGAVTRRPRRCELDGCGRRHCTLRLCRPHYDAAR